MKIEIDYEFEFDIRNQDILKIITENISQALKPIDTAIKEICDKDFESTTHGLYNWNDDKIGTIQIYRDQS